MPPSDSYFLGHSSEEQRRLQQQARELAPDSIWLFDHVPLSAGFRVVEIGCGPEGCLNLLSDRVGRTGSVVGVEVSEEAVAMAKALVAGRQLRNVEVRQADAKATGLPRNAFDLATARLVLVNVQEPEAIVAEMVAVTRSGGVVALHEADWEMVHCDPPLPAWDDMIQAFLAYSRANGIDAKIGRRLASLLRTAGLVDIRTRPFFHTYEIDHSRRTIFPQFARNLRERMLSQRILGEVEFDRCVEALQRHLADPATLVIWAYFQAWGTKP